MSSISRIIPYILKLTSNQPVEVKRVIEESRLPPSVIMNTVKVLEEEGLVTADSGKLRMTCEQRVRAAVKAIELGLDVEKACTYLTWDEFESISEFAFQENGFKTRRHVRFRSLGRRWEVDVLAWRGRIAVSVDCKHWRRNWSLSSIRRIVEAHLARTEALTYTIPELMQTHLERVKYVVPTVLSLIPGSIKFYMDVPIVPVLQLRDFITALPEHLYPIKTFVRS